ncbi:DUF2442 domain-containing protein [Leptothrix ochracea]
MLGAITSAAEVTHISKHGFWMLLGDEELLLPFAQFPWFKQATVEQITDVEWPTPNHLYWPSLDVDLCVDAIRRPSDFPLVSGRSSAQSTGQFSPVSRKKLLRTQSIRTGNPPTISRVSVLNAGQGAR